MKPKQEKLATTARGHHEITWQGKAKETNSK
jgi:hypothetical protein